MSMTDDRSIEAGPRAIKTISPGETSAATESGSKAAAIEDRIAEARHNLTTRLSELERRVDDVKQRIDPRSWFDSPWVRVGVAAALGFALGATRSMRRL